MSDVSLGLPSHLAQRATSGALMRALRTVGLTSLSAAFLIAVVYQAATPTAMLWPAMIAVVPMAVLLWLQRHVQSLLLSVAYLAIGGGCTYWYIVTFCSQIEPIASNDSFSVALPKIALLTVGGIGAGLVSRFVWVVVGYIVAEVAGAAALLTAGLPLQFDKSTFYTMAGLSVIMLSAYLSRRRVLRTQPLLHRAARDEQVATLRNGIETRAAALMHDTALSQLAAIANSTGPTLDPRLRAEIQRDLQTLAGEEWLADDAPTPRGSAPDARSSGIATAIREAQSMGLTVEVSGDTATLARLSAEADKALGLAVKQCLVNVLKHSGTDRAEVVAYGTDDEISVMVIDAGRGFSEAEAGTDRLGLRSSVRRRMESVGGAVRVWSTPGRGTSIMIRVPAHRAPLQVPLRRR